MANSTRQNRLLSGRYLPHFAAILVTAIAMAGFIFLGSLEKERNLLHYRSYALSRLNAASERLQNIINSSLIPIEGLSAFVSIHPEITRTEFDEFAKQIIAQHKSIHSIELVKGSVITGYIYPLKGNESAIGVDLMSLPTDRETVRKAIDTKKTVIAGPINLIQGGIAFIGRTPIFISSGKKSSQKDKYWGLAQAIISTEAVFKEAGLYDNSSDLYFAIRGMDAKGAAGDVFFGDKAVFQSNPLTTEVLLFNGSWQLAVIPKAGWDSVSVVSLRLKAASLVISLVLGSLFFCFLRNQQNIMKTEKRFRTLYESSRDAVMTLTPDQGFLGGNPATVALFGCRDEKEFATLSPTSVSPEFQPDGSRSVDKAQEMMRLALERGSHFFEWTHKQVDGTEFFADVLLTRMESDGKKLLQATVRNITERKRAEETLKKYSEELEERVRERTRSLESANTELKKIFNAIEQAAESVLITDINGTIQYVNPAFSAITGYSKEEALGQNPRVFKSGLNPPEIYKNLWDTILAGNIWKGTIINKRKSGDIYYEEMTVTPVMDTIGKTTNFVAIKDNVTDRVKAEEELKQKNIELEATKNMAEAANRAKSEFLANMSHELRTPLNSIIGFSQVIIDGLAGPTTPEQKEYANDILESGRHLLSIITDILDLSRIEAGREELEITEFPLELLLKESLMMFNEKAIKHNIKLTTDVAGDIGNIKADARKIKQVIINLLSNAIKFTPDGGSVSVQARKIHDAGYTMQNKEKGFNIMHPESGIMHPDGDFIEISVADTGIGIKEEDMQRLFRPFEQLEVHLTKKYAGTGLGLTLCRKFVEMHEGRIWAESEFGKGSRFTFIIPIS